MAQYTLTGPDGRKVTLTAPDDASDDQIKAKISSVKENWGRLPAAQPQDDGLSPLDRQMDERVAKEGNLDAATRVFNKGMPWGSFLDEATAGIKSVLPTSLGGMPYDEAVALERAKDRASEKQYSGWGGTALKVGGAVASAPFLPVAKAFQGATLLPSMGNAALTGLGYGAAYGAGESENGGRFENALKGGVTGAAVGGALVPVARGIGNSIEYMTNAGKAPGALANYDRNAVGNVLNDFKADTMTPAMYAQKAADLGDQGMLADMGENMLLTTNALGNTPGKQMQVVRDRIGDRTADAPRRIFDMLNSELGVPKDIPSYMRSQKEYYGKLAKPYYDQFENSKIPMSPKLENILKRVDASGVVDEAERLAKIEGRTLGRIRNQPAAPLGDDLSPKERVELSQLKDTLKGTDPNDARTIWDMFQYAKSAKVDKAQSLASWLVDKGGVKNQGDEIRYILGRVKDRPGLVNSKGMDIDEAALAAWQAGFFKGERPTAAEFLNALDDDLSGLSKVARGSEATMEEIDHRVASDMESELYNLGIGMNTSDRVLRKALGMTPPTQAQAKSEITPREWDYYKRGIQALIDRKYPKDTEMGRALTQLDNELRAAVDESLNPIDPSKSSWATARGLVGRDMEGRQGVEIGRKVFRGEGLRPYDLKEELRKSSQYKQEGIKIGARDELNSKMGRGATNFGPKGDVTARRALNSDFSRQNLEQVAGSGPAQRISRNIDTENNFADTYNEVTANSATPKRQAAQRRLPIMSERPISDATPSSVGALAVLGAKKIINMITAGALNERAERIMLDQAKMLTARGASRDAIAQSLIQMANARNLNAAQKDAVISVLNKLSRGAIAPSVEAVTSQRSNP